MKNMSREILDRRKRRGSAMLDYVILFFVIATVAVLLGGYLQRSLMGKYRDVGDTISSGVLYNGTK